MAMSLAGVTLVRWRRVAALLMFVAIPVCLYTWVWSIGMEVRRLMLVYPTSEWAECDAIETSIGPGMLAWGKLCPLSASDRALANGRDKHGFTALQRASQWDHFRMAQLLLARGADVNAKDRGGDTALYRASGAGSKRIAQLLLGAGAAVDSADAEGLTPLTNSMDFQMGDFLVSKGANINVRAKDGRSLLHEAIENQNLAAVIWIVSRGGDVNLPDSNFGNTPLHFAAMGSETEIVQFLIRKGADRNARNHKGQTPLALASQRGRQRVAELLRQRRTEGLSQGAGTPRSLGRSLK